MVVLRGLIQPIAAPVVALENPGRDRVPALARLATWRDLGAGAGPLLAGALLPLVAPAVLYGTAAGLLAISAIAVSAAAAKPSAAPLTRMPGPSRCRPALERLGRIPGLSALTWVGRAGGHQGQRSGTLYISSTDCAPGFRLVSPAFEV